MSGTIDGPNYHSKSGTVDDIYMKYGVAGDQFAGRVLCELPVHSSHFAVLPPHFVYNEEWPKERVNEVMSSVFAASLMERTRLYPVLRICFASVIFHSDWILHNAPSDSVIRQLPVFSHTGFTTDWNSHIGI